MLVARILILMAGVANFAMHRWMIESKHPVVEAALSPIHRLLGHNVTYLIEFALLLLALWLVADHSIAAIAAYGVYTALNVGTVGYLKGG